MKTNDSIHKINIKYFKLIWFTDFQGAHFEWLMKYYSTVNSDMYILYICTQKQILDVAKIVKFSNKRENHFNLWMYVFLWWTVNSKFYESVDNAWTSYIINSIWIIYFILFHTRRYRGNNEEWKIIIKLRRAQFWVFWKSNLIFIWCFSSMRNGQLPFPSGKWPPLLGQLDRKCQ